MGKDRSLDNTTTYFGFIWKVANNNNKKNRPLFFFYRNPDEKNFFYLALSHIV